MVLNIKKESFGAWILVTLEGSLDAMTAPQFDQEVFPEVEKRLDIALDVSKLQYISSMGLRSLSRLAKKTGEVYHHVAICGMTGEVKNVITSSKVDAFLEVYEKLGDLPFTVEIPVTDR